MLNSHVIGLRSMRRRDDHRRALIGQLTVQSDLLATLPNLSSANERDVELFSSRSTPVMIAARQKHLELISDLKKPWWETMLTQNDNPAVNGIDHDGENLLANSRYVTDYIKNF